MLMRYLLMRSLLLATVASSVNAWSYSDGPGRSWTVRPQNTSGTHTATRNKTSLAE